MCKSKWTFFPTYTVFTTTIQIRYTYPIGILISVHEKIIRQCLIITFFRKSQWTKSKEATELKGDLHGCPCESYTLLRRLPLTASKQPRDGLCRYTFFCQITTLIIVHVAFVFGLQTL